MVTAPALVGLFRPLIVLPEQEYSTEQLVGILQHELIHLRRFDILIKWLSILACSLHWFNPLIWIAKREVNRTCELSCDAVVIHSMKEEEKMRYGSTLISLAAASKCSRTVLSAAMYEKKETLKERLLFIKNFKHKKGSSLYSSLILIAAVCFAICLSASATYGQNTNSVQNSLNSQVGWDNQGNQYNRDSEDSHDSMVSKDVQAYFENAHARDDIRTHDTNAGEPAETGYALLRIGEELRTGQNLYSSDGRLKLVMETSGNLIYYADNKSIWDSGTSSPYAKMVLQTNGDMVILSSAGSKIWSSGTAETGVTKLVLEEDGFSLRTYNNTGIWSTQSQLIRTQRLGLGRNLVSPNGNYTFTVEPPGNLVLHTRNGEIHWKSDGPYPAGTYPNAFAQFDRGSFLIYSAAGDWNVLWAVQTGDQARAFLDNDGRFIVRKNDGTTLWLNNTFEARKD
jgi:hypothetical protein